MSISGTVYLIHFERPLAHARHYLGWTQDLERRLDLHALGSPKGSRLMAAVEAAGIDWTVVRTWEGDRYLERRLKNQKNAGARLCPRCRAEKASRKIQRRRHKLLPGEG